MRTTTPRSCSLGWVALVALLMQWAPPATAGKLLLAVSPSYEAKASYAIRRRTIDQEGACFEQAVTFSVTNVNEAPITLTLSATSIAENVAANAAVGTFTTTDPDASNPFTYTLVTGTGSTGNARLNIPGTALRITASPDFENKPGYAVRVRVTDQDGLFFEKAFTIVVINGPNRPADPTPPTVASASLRLVLWPSPAVGSVVRLEAPVDALATILDAAGRTGRTISVADGGQFEMAGLIAGLYTVGIGTATARLALDQLMFSPGLTPRPPTFKSPHSSRPYTNG